ncbi:MAG: aspartate aminotransferase family protein [Anaerolineales bacterium]|nr:aspartate aminotransferase family protein [Anaerolineales bacterium]MCX7754791.1 aspartate aminotransferase family protein [Anaerolineales bacterium]MDW8279086.1 guanitoxin biosynthesis PLP-dependent transaminase GntE [Anaerolineales bacterium]
MKNFQKNVELQQRAKQVLPLGVNSNFRYWGEGITPYVKKAKGSHLWDVGGNEYIDYRLAFGPIILGHAYDEVDEKVIEEVRNGVLFAMTGELELDVAEMIVEMCPGVEMVRTACSGTEATMHAIRVARAYTGRELILKFEGNYHGFQDHTLWSTYAPAEAYGNRRSPIPIPASSGIPRALGQAILTLPFNDFEGFERVMRSYGEQIAAVITEPCQGNCAAILPQPGFLELIRQKTSEYGAVFILDEVKTGFRIAKGGAQEYYNLKPDLATYAKALGNGYPIAAFGGKREIMSIIGHGVSQGGTYTNNKPGIAGAWATLKIMQREPVHETIQQRGTRLMNGLREIFDENGIQAVVSGYPAMFSFAVGIDSMTCQRDWTQSDRDLYLRWAEAAMERGVMPDYDPREPWFLSYSHTDADIDRTLEVYAEVVRTVK